MKKLNKILWKNMLTITASCALVSPACASKLFWRYAGGVLPEWAGVPTETTLKLGIPNNGVLWSQRTPIGKLAMLKDVSWKMGPTSRLVIDGDDVHISSGTGEWWGSQLGATLGLGTATAHNNSTIDALLDIFPKSIDREELLQRIFGRDSAEGLRGQDIKEDQAEQVLKLAEEYFIVFPEEEWNKKDQTDEDRSRILIRLATSMQEKIEEGKSFVLVIAGNECFLCLETEGVNNVTTHEALFDMCFKSTQKKSRQILLRSIHGNDPETSISTLMETNINLDVLKSFIESGLGIPLLF